MHASPSPLSISGSKVLVGSKQHRESKGITSDKYFAIFVFGARRQLGLCRVSGKG